MFLQWEIQDQKIRVESDNEDSKQENKQEAHVGRIRGTRPGQTEWVRSGLTLQSPPVLAGRSALP